MSAIPAVPAVEAPDRRKPIVAIFDLDRTITRRGTWTPFLLSVARRRPRKLLAVAPILLAALRYRRGRIGRSAVKEIMLRKVLTGIPRTEIAAEAKTFVDRLVRTGLCPGALQAIERHRRAGHRLVLATAAVDFLAERLAARLGIDMIVCTPSRWDSEDRIGDRFGGENCYGASKLRAVRRALPAPREEWTLIAYSDSVADFPLLRWADMAFVVNPSRRAKALARREGFQVVDWLLPSERAVCVSSRCRLCGDFSDESRHSQRGPGFAPASPHGRLSEVPAAARQHGQHSRLADRAARPLRDLGDSRRGRLPCAGGRASPGATEPARPDAPDGLQSLL